MTDTHTTPYIPDAVVREAPVNIDKLIAELKSAEDMCFSWSGSALLANELNVAETDEGHISLYKDLCGLGNAMSYLQSEVRSLSAEPAQGDQWQDISTAEERAFDVILRVPDPTRAKGYKEVIGHWAQDLSGEEQPPFRGWFTDAGFGFREVYPAPTHWRRLPPAAPNSEAGNDKG